MLRVVRSSLIFRLLVTLRIRAIASTHPHTQSTDHGNRSCEYQIVNGPPSNFLSHPELLLNTYRDTDVFQDQALTSPSYSIYIPPGCAPSIALMTYSLGTDATPRLRNCGGTVFLVVLEDQTSVPLYQIDADYFCDLFPVNISFQTNSMGFGQISVQYLKNFGDDWIDSDINTTLSNVQEVKLQCHIMSKWEKYKRCFVKIHFVRSFDNRFDDQSPQKKLKTLNNFYKSIKEIDSELSKLAICFFRACVDFRCHPMSNDDKAEAKVDFILCFQKVFQGMKLEIELLKNPAVYHEGEKIEAILVVQTKEPMKIKGITAKCEGLERTPKNRNRLARCLSMKRKRKNPAASSGTQNSVLAR
ncbi:unnamed protein product, partial [Mesorhabditis belari]|uniref:Uncharacterized protein n=1 Tax=Mesorhabditis belari TaxID=2138241 RepID=A0AAF3F8X9_9BILA